MQLTESFLNGEGVLLLNYNLEHWRYINKTYTYKNFPEITLSIIHIKIKINSVYFM